MSTKAITRSSSGSSTSSPRLGKAPNLNSNSPSTSLRKKPPPQILHRKNEYKSRNSRFDRMEKEVQSEFYGFYNLVVIGLIMFFFTAQMRNLVYEGTLVGIHAINRIFERYDLVPFWIAQVVFSFVTYLIQKLVLLIKLPSAVSKFFHFSSMLILFGGTVWIVHEGDFPIVQSCFLLAEMLILLMKMHSYFITNLEHRHMTPQQIIESNKALDEKLTEESEKDAKPPTVKYPDNVTLYNYADFLLIPTLCYELEYPRTNKIRWIYVFEKVAALMGIWACLHVLMFTFVTPVLESVANMPAFDAICKLIFPFMLAYLLLFYIVFEVICNGFAEVSRFADREFYSDWWNSTAFDEFARKWNKPVHEWLLRHIYLESIISYKVSKKSATLLTFLFSSVFHELFMAFVLRVYKPWLFLLQMFQLPLIFMGRHPRIRGQRLGNYIFWMGMMVGPPLLSVLYCREYFKVN